MVQNKTNENQKQKPFEERTFFLVAADFLLTRQHLLEHRPKQVIELVELHSPTLVRVHSPQEAPAEKGSRAARAGVRIRRARHRAKTHR